MSILKVIFIYIFWIATCAFGWWEWHDSESDFMEQGFGCCYVIFSILFLFFFTAALLTGNILL